jgi:pimeloyl-ACP methyl ester carboxylesterase
VTAAPPPARPLYLAADPDVVFGMFHAPAGEPGSKTAVLLAPPWGWNEVASYRSRRTWAEHLAEHGHPTLRIDFPGAGDSAGSPGDPARLEAWTAAIVAATTWLSGTTPAGRVAVIGLGLGGLVAGHALAAGAPIHELVLWAAPTLGRSLLREQRAFGKLQSDRYGSIEGMDQILPDGWLEIGGFVQSAETIAAVQEIDLREMPTETLGRALLLGRDGLPVDAGLQGRLEQAGVDVTVAPGPGWEDMCFHPERYQPPVGVFRLVTDWLAAGEGPDPGPPRAAATTPARASADAQALIPVDGVVIRETALAGDDFASGSFGIVAEPTEAPPSDVCAVFLNAGAVRRMGPNRMWVEAARRWAARGIPTVRVDVEGIGDADGDAGMYFDVANFYTPDREAQVSAIIDVLAARGLGPRFVLIGLCAGAYSGFHTAAVDRRVVEAIAINPRVLVWDPSIMVRRNASLVNKVLELGSWQRILAGETSPGRMLAIGRAAASEAPRAARRYAGRLRGGRQRDPWMERLERRFDELGDAQTRVVLAFAGDEPVFDELKADGILDRLAQWPNIVLTDLPGDDHTLRPVAAQRALHQFLDRELDRLVGARAGSRRELSGSEPGRQPG